MADELLTTRETASRLGITVATLYDWLGRSDHGLLVIQAQNVTIDYFQGGARGQGRIRIPAGEVERIRELMRVRPRATCPRQSPRPRPQFRHITATPGRPPEE